MRGLLIRERWIALILAGKKTWEMRSKPTKVRGKIGLIRSGSGLIVGTAHLIDSERALTRQDYMAHQGRHAIPADMLDEVVARGWVHPWVLDCICLLAEPVPYSHPAGAVIFVNLDASVMALIEGAISHPMSLLGESPGEVAQVIEGHPARREQACSDDQPKPAAGLTKMTDATWFVFRPETAQAYGREFPTESFWSELGRRPCAKGHRM